MHRGSSKGASERGAPENLPLSASPPPTVRIELEFVRAGTSTLRTVELPCGSPLRQALRAAGRSAEGCAVLLDTRPIPLDTPVRSAARYTVLSTFSGG